VLIDASFVDVLCDDSDERHEAAAGAFEGLLTEYERGTTLLYSHGGVVAEVGARRRAELLAVCHVVRRRRWLTREAQRVRRRHPTIGDDRAATLVLMRRWGIGEIASFDPFLVEHGIPTIPIPIVTAGCVATAKLSP